MEKTDYGNLRAAFLKAFASIPDSLRNEIICIVDKEPYSWLSSYIEVRKGTEKSLKILESLKKLEII